MNMNSPTRETTFDESTNNVDVSVILVSYNTKELLHRCIRSVYDNTEQLGLQIIVLDNASLDGSADMVAQEFPDIDLLALDKNIGFGPACNRAAEMATGTYVCLLNPDAMLMQNTLDILVDFARRNPRAGLWGGRAMKADGSVDPSSSWALPSLWSLFCFATGLSTAFKRHTFFNPEPLVDWNRDSVRTVGVISGFLLLVRRDVWQRLDGFDDTFFMYGEDADLCHRAAELGYCPTITPDAMVTHVGGASSKAKADKLVLLMKGKVTYARKHWHGWKQLAAVMFLRSGVLLRSIAPEKAFASADTDAMSWRVVWQRRGEWKNGYPAPSNAATSNPATPSARRRAFSN